MLDFDQFFRTETSFDGGVLEIALGTPAFAGPFPNNVTTFDLGNYIVQGGYAGPLDGTLEGAAILSPLQGRLAFTGTKEWHHVRVALGTFAPGGANNPLGLPVFLRFRMTSDVATSAGFDGGWYVDNLAINNYTGCGLAMVEVNGSETLAAGGFANADSLLDFVNGRRVGSFTDPAHRWHTDALGNFRRLIINHSRRADG
jgi:hypothetical protein